MRYSKFTAFINKINDHLKKHNYFYLCGVISKAYFSAYFKVLLIQKLNKSGMR